MAIDAVLTHLRETGWKLKMTTSKDDNCAFAFTAHKSGIGIGPSGLYGYGSTPQIALNNLLEECKSVLEKGMKESKEE
jgi:hypothetical protein